MILCDSTRATNLQLQIAHDIGLSGIPVFQDSLHFFSEMALSTLISLHFDPAPVRSIIIMFVA